MALIGGGRAAFGLFVSPLNTASGIGLPRLSLAIALGQLGIGLTQPLAGALVDRVGAARVVITGAVLLAASTVLPSAWPLPWVVALSLVASAVAGSAVGSNGVLLGEVNRGVPVGAGTSLGQLLLGPATQWAIDRRGWPWALAATAIVALLALPLALPLRRRPLSAAMRTAPPVADVLRDIRFWRVALSFGMCGFHVGFLGVHIPGVIERCGLPPALAGGWIAISGAANIAGSLAIGIALKRYDPARLLVATYAVRVLGIVGLLVLPATQAVLLGFAVAMGASFMATLPPTSALVARQHGIQRLGALFGIVMLVHQVGSFSGIWLGGWAALATGSDRLLWGVDIALALGAMVLVWPRKTSG